MEPAGVAVGSGEAKVKGPCSPALAHSPGARRDPRGVRSTEHTASRNVAVQVQGCWEQWKKAPWLIYVPDRGQRYSCESIWSLRRVDGEGAEAKIDDTTSRFLPRMEPVVRSGVLTGELVI